MTRAEAITPSSVAAVNHRIDKERADAAPVRIVVVDDHGFRTAEIQDDGAEFPETRLRTTVEPLRHLRVPEIRRSAFARGATRPRG